MNLSLTNILRLALVMLLLLCLADMPYGYFMFVRTVCAVAFAYFALVAYQNNKQELQFIFIGLCVLFQPFYKIALGRSLWNLVDVAVAIFLIAIIWKENQNNENSKSKLSN